MGPLPAQPRLGQWPGTRPLDRRADFRSHCP